MEHPLVKPEIRPIAVAVYSVILLQRPETTERAGRFDDESL
jgi:hypothetical protein